MLRRQFLMHNVRGFLGIFNEQRLQERIIDDLKQMKQRTPLNYTVKFYNVLPIYSAITRTGPFGTKLIQ